MSVIIHHAKPLSHLRVYRNEHCSFAVELFGKRIGCEANMLATLRPYRCG